MLSQVDDAMQLELSECAICFESLYQEIALPCSCKVSYCARCWDRSLAQSLNSCGQARCPTCRAIVHVDFDTDRACLVFSRELDPFVFELSTAGPEDFKRVLEGRAHAIGTLREKARPAQIRLLEQHGLAHPEFHDIVDRFDIHLFGLSIAELSTSILSLGGAIVDCSEKTDLVKRLQDIVNSGDQQAIAEHGRESRLAHVLGSAFVTASREAPKCVCGSFLKRVSGRERACMCLRGLSPGSPGFEEAFNRVTMGDSSGCFCDLCTENVPLSSYVWTCENENSTVLHATSYDVCDGCFLRFTCGAAGSKMQQEGSR